MAYIDDKKLKNDVMNSWNEEHSTIATSRLYRDLMLIIERQPTEDVVPRAEFEQLQHKYALAVAEREANVKGFTEELAKANAEIERLIAQNCELAEKGEKVCIAYKNVKTEVARGICAEIRENSSSCVVSYDGEEIYHTQTYTISAMELDEIIMKYTEGE